MIVRRTCSWLKFCRSASSGSCRNGRCGRTDGRCRSLLVWTVLSQSCIGELSKSNRKRIIAEDGVNIFLWTRDREGPISFIFFNFYGKSRHTRKVSPTIQEGAELPVLSSKKAPRHCVLVNRESWKSAGLMVQFLPPKDIWTLTVVLQANNRVGISTEPVKQEKIKMHDKCSNFGNPQFQDSILVFEQIFLKCTGMDRQPVLFPCRWRRRMIDQMVNL